ncbi:MAG: sulfur globule protein precursor [Xanthobacteraceae bacterium]
MIQKTLIALVALTALAGVSATDAVARGHGGGGHAHFSGGGARSFAHVGGGGRSFGHVGRWGGSGFAFRRHHRHFFGPRFGYYPYAYYDNGCYRWRRVPTRHGWRLRRVWVCGLRYY